MAEPFYIGYRRVESGLQPVNITKDLSLVTRLLRSGEVDSFLVGYEAPGALKGREHIFNSRIHALPWRDVDSRVGTRVADTLSRYVHNHDYKGAILHTTRRPTAGAVWHLFNSAETEGRQLPRISNYGPRSHEITYEVFRRAGLELPEVKIAL